MKNKQKSCIRIILEQIDRIFPLMVALLLSWTVERCRPESGRPSVHMKSPEGLQRAADAAYESDNFEDCARLYTSLIEADSTSQGEFYFRRGRCLSQLEGNDSLALTDFAQALAKKYDPYKCHYSLGFINMVLKNDSAAVLHFEECLKIRDDKPEVREMLRSLKPESI